MAANMRDVVVVELCEAAERGDLQRVHSLLAHGAEVNRKAKDGTTALQRAAEKGHVNVAEALLARGAEVNGKTDAGEPALHFAAWGGHVAMVAALLARGAKVNGKDKDGNTALLRAAENGFVTVVDALLAHGAEVNRTNVLGESALQYAAWAGQIAVVEALLARGAEVNKTDVLGRTALHCAVELGNRDLVKAFLARGADVHSTTTLGNTPLHVAAKRQEHFAALELWRAGADPFRQNNTGETPLSLLPQNSDVAKQMRTAPPPHPDPSSPQAEARKILSFLASRSHSIEQTITAQDAIPELQQVLQLHLSQAKAGATVNEDDVEDAVLKQMDRKTGLLRMDAVIKSFYELQKKYPIVKRRREPPELRTIFKNATRSKNVLRTKLAKLLLRELFDESGCEPVSSRAAVTFTRSRNKWNESDVDTLLADHRQDRNVVDEEGFVKVGMKVLFA